MENIITKRQENVLKKNFAKSLSENEKKNEKIKRERNRLEFENKILIREAQEKERIIETTETYLIQRIEKLKESCVSQTAIYELEILLNGLREERSAIRKHGPKGR